MAGKFPAARWTKVLRSAQLVVTSEPLGNELPKIPAPDPNLLYPYTTRNMRKCQLDFSFFERLNWQECKNKMETALHNPLPLYFFA